MQCVTVPIDILPALKDGEDVKTGSVAVRAEFCVIRWFIGLIVPPTNRRFGIPDRIRTGVFSLKG